MQGLQGVVGRRRRKEGSGEGWRTEAVGWNCCSFLPRKVRVRSETESRVQPKAGWMCALGSVRVRANKVIQFV